MSTKRSRAFVATTSLIAVGALLGSIVAGSCLLLLGIPHWREWDAHTLVVVPLLGTVVGAPLGAVLAPLLAWTLLRNVAIGRALLACSLGALVGALAWFAIGYVLNLIGDGFGVFFLIGGAIFGVVLTAWMQRVESTSAT